MLRDSICMAIGLYRSYTALFCPHSICLWGRFPLCLSPTYYPFALRYLGALRGEGLHFHYLVVYFFSFFFTYHACVGWWSWWLSDRGMREFDHFAISI